MSHVACLQAMRPDNTNDKTGVDVYGTVMMAYSHCKDLLVYLMKAVSASGGSAN